MRVPRLVRSVSVLVAIAAAAGASACRPAAREPAAESARPPSPACKGRLAATDVPPEWQTFPIVAESGLPVIVEEVDSGDDRVDVKEAPLDRFLVRYGLRRGEAVGPVQLRERDCGAARLLFVAPQWDGGSVQLRRRLLEHVLTWTPPGAAETPLGAFRWIPS